jgi:hypothetical protein
VLDEHFVDGVAADVGVERKLAEGEEVREGILKWLIAVVRLFDFGGEASGEFGDTLLEFFDGFLEASDFGLGVGVEAEEEVGDVERVGEVGFEDLSSVLI